MDREIAVPEMGEGVTEIAVVRWLKGVGDEIRVNEPIVAIETDKASMEIDAPFSGKLVEILVQEGDSPEIGEPIARVEVSS